mgnify:CR=1 FL=1
MARYVCSEPRELDAPWMTAALEGAGVALGATVTHVDFVGLVGTGQMAQTARFLLTWDHPDGRPSSVVGKFPSTDSTARTTGFERGSYRSEWEFYNDVVRTLRIRTPHCWVSRFRPEDQDFVLLMEDLSNCRQGDQLEGLTVDQVALAVEAAVGMHAPRFGDPTLGEFCSTRARGKERAVELAAVYGLCREPMLARLGDGLSPDVVKFINDLVPHVERWAEGTDTPRTFVHFDYRADNFMFGVTPEAPALAVVDWQTASDALGLIDVAYAVGGCLEPSVRASVERDLVNDYADRMQAQGVALDRSTAWRDYRHSSIWGVIMSVIATVLAAETDRGNDMLTSMAEHHGRHAIDLDALAMLR